MHSRSITLVRHGHREDFIGNEWAPVWGQTAARPHDPNISERGIAEATALGKKLAAEPFALVLASPFLRTVHTGSLIAREMGSEVRVEHGLHEWLHPDWFPTQPHLRTMTELQELFGNVDQRHFSATKITYPETSLGAVVTRAGDVLESILNSYPDDLILVTHADPLLGFLMAVGIEACRQPIRTCSVYRVEGSPGNWSLAVDGSTDHLDS